MKTTSRVLLSLVATCAALNYPAAAAPGDVDASFNPGANLNVLTMAMQPDQSILAGGRFTTLVGSNRNRIGRIGASGALDAGFNPDANNAVNSVATLANGNVLIAGDFTTLAGVTRSRIARLNSDGSLDSGFAPGVSNNIFCLAVQTNGQIIMGGAFTNVDGTTRNRLARLNPDGTLDGSFNPDVSSGSVRSLSVQPDGKIVLGGSFTNVGGMERNRIARLEMNGTVDTLFNPNADNIVYSTVVQPDGKIVIGGNFASVAGTTRNRLARLLADGTLETSFDPNGGSGIIFTMAQQTDGRILLGGSFTTVGGVARNRLARLNADGTLDTTFNPNANGQIEGLALQADGKIVVGGGFSQVGGADRLRLARLDNDAATQSLSVYLSTNRVEWLRGGASPETLEVTFDLSTNAGVSWTTLGSGTRMVGGWEFSGVTLPALGYVRARARTAGGQYSSSPGLVETVAAFGRTTPIITWSDPAPITYGTALAGTQLNATAEVAGNFAYTPAAGAVLNVGTNVLRAVFTPADSASFYGATQLVSIAVTKAPLTVSADNKSRRYGITNPTLTATITGFANAETLGTSDVAGSPTLSTTATIDSPMNSYPIVAALGTLESSNYLFATFAPGTLTVGLPGTPDTVRPTLTVKSPAASSTRVLTNVITITGTAKDNRGVALVLVKKGTNDFVVAQGNSNWTATVTLDPGTNILRFKVTDTSANVSVTNTRIVFYVVRLPLTVTANGPGRTSYTNQQLLEFGKGYTITATPASGHLFSNWISGSLATVNASRPFIMSSNLSLTANFVPNPFTGTQLKGSYSGLYHPMTVNPPHEQSGFFQVTVTTKGTYSGKLYLMGTSYPISGKLNLALAATKSIKRRNTNDLLVGLQFELGTNQVSGFVSNQFWNSELFGYRATFDTKTNPATNFLGNYTMLVAGGTNAALHPSGQGVTTLGISRGGSVSLKGNLADGSPAAQKVALAANGQFPLYQNLYRGKGSLLGWVTFANTPSNDTPGLLLWTKKNGASSTFYPGGFTNEALTLGSRYVAPGRGTNAVAFSNAAVVLEGGNLTASLTNDVLLGALNKVTVSTNSTNQLKLTLTTSSGLTEGSFLNPAKHKKSLLKGVLLQKQNVSGGYFLGTNQSGKLYFGPTNGFPIVFPEVETP